MPDPVTADNRVARDLKRNSIVCVEAYRSIFLEIVLESCNPKSAKKSEKEKFVFTRIFLEPLLPLTVLTCAR